MSDKPDLSELFSMLAEEKAKNSYNKKTDSKKSKTYKADFMEEFSKELKKLKEEEEQQKREVAAMEEWLTSPVENNNEEVKNEVETSEEETESEEPVVFEEEEIEEEIEIIAETPLQEEALQYLHTKREELTEEAKQIKGIKREMASFSDQLTKLRMLMQNAGGGGIAKIRQADDIDRTTALVNNKYLKYDSSTGKFVGADASGGGGDYGDSDVNTLLGAVTVDIIPNTTESIDLGSSSKRFNELFLAGQTIDLGGTKITKDTDGNVELKDGNDALKKIIVDEIQLGSGDDKLKIQKSNGKLKVLDNSDAKASHDVAFSEITSTPTTIAGYGITDAFDGAYSSLTGTPTIPSDVNDLTDADSLLGGGGISLTALSINPVEGTASGDGGLAYNNLTGVFTYTPPDLSSYLTSYTVTSGDVTAHEADITITESQISDLQSYLTSYTVTESDVTAHQAALSITESQISDLQSYLTSVSEAAVTAHEAALTITESQISDFGTYLTSVPAQSFASLTGKPTTIAGYGITDAFDGAYGSLTGAPTIPTVDSTSVTAAGALMDSEVTNLAQVKAFDSSDYATAAQGTKADTAHGWGNHADAGYLTSFTETNDLSSAVTWANVPNANITEGSVTQHQAALSITESQISDLQSYITGYTVTSGDVTAHEADITITESQISDLGTYATVASPTLTGTPAAPTAATGTDTTQLATTAFVQQEINALKALLYAYDQS